MAAVDEEASAGDANKRAARRERIWRPFSMRDVPCYPLAGRAGTWSQHEKRAGLNNMLNFWLTQSVQLWSVFSDLDFAGRVPLLKA
jgi:hypothetical protein